MNKQPQFPIDALAPLIEVIARAAVAEHLTPKNQDLQASRAKRSNRVLSKQLASR